MGGSVPEWQAGTVFLFGMIPVPRLFRFFLLSVVFHHFDDGDDVGERNKYEGSRRRDGKGFDGRKTARDLEEDARKPDHAAPENAHGQAGRFNAVGGLLGDEVGSGVGCGDGKETETDEGDETQRRAERE